LANEEHINRLTAHLFREFSGKMVAVLSSKYGIEHLDLTMDIVQETFEAALTHWKFKGIPDNCEGWLMTVAKNKAVNAFVREKRNRELNHTVYKQEDAVSAEDIPLLQHEISDSQMRLLMMCCHPDFSERQQVMLTLHILCGFGTAEIGSALLMRSEAVKKTLFRLKAQLKVKENLLQNAILPGSAERISIVHTILYLIFNEGYKCTRGKEIIDHDLCYEALRLAKMLLTGDVALPGDTSALLALMCFNLARFPARIDADDELLTLEEQDRSKWNRVFIEEGFYYLKESRQGDHISRYHIEAAISSFHCSAATFNKTDWSAIVRMYEQLEIVAPSPMVKLNKLLALSYSDLSANIIGDIEGLQGIPLFADHYILHATLGNIYQRQGDHGKAGKAYEQALHLAITEAEQKLFRRKMAECNHTTFSYS
jgi:RNA polymerase sigma factor (sigma-70 family)